MARHDAPSTDVRRRSLLQSKGRLNRSRGTHILVRMTRKRSTTKTAPDRAASRAWRLQDAKARFSEVVRLASSEGPQHVTLHGVEAVVVVDAGAYRRMQGEPSGQQLVDALKASPHRDLDLQPIRGAMPVRGVKL